MEADHIHLSDESLLALLARGDRAAFTSIYRRHWRTVYGIAYNRLKDSGLAEDLTHDVMTSLWQNRESSHIQNLPAYLATAVKYLVLSAIHKQQKQLLYESETGRTAETWSYSAEESLHYKLILEMIEVEVLKLPEKCRLIFEYSRNENLSTQEIADKLGISKSTVENQLNKALKRLRTALKHVHFMLTLFI